MSGEIGVPPASVGDVLWAAKGLGWPAWRGAGVGIGAGEDNWRQCMTPALAAAVWAAWRDEEGGQCMTDTPSRAMLLELGEDLGYPSVTIGGAFTFLGADAWRATAAVATPIERRAWLQALGELLLVSTPSSRERMAAWRARASWSAPTTPVLIRENLLFFGDASVFAHVLAAFQYLPECVRDHTLREVAFEAVGADTCAWIGSSTMVDRDGTGRPWTVRLSGADRHLDGLVHTVLHEVAHSWTLPTPHALVSVQGEQGLRAFLAEECLTESADKKVAFGERVAEALALVWGAR